MEGCNRNKSIALLYVFICSFNINAYHCKINFVPEYEAIDSQYIGYPATWGSKKVDYMYGNSPEANMEMGPFIRTGTPFNF